MRDLYLKESYKELETPCYILDESKLHNNYHNLETSFKKRWGNFKIGYSYKTNSLPWVLNFMKKRGAYAEVVSEPEYRLALRLGYKPSEVIINGPYKGYEAIREILEDGGIVNLDSFHEINWLKENKPKKKKQWEVGLRINFDLEKRCPEETIMGKEPGRFGFNIENGSFKKALDILDQLDYVKVIGIHGHHSTKTKSLNIFKAISEEIVNVSKEILNDIKYVDIGGCVFGDKPGAPTFEEYAEVICSNLEKAFDKNKVSLILEPGAALIASPFKYLCKVIDKKDIFEKRIVSTDGSLIHIDPQMHGISFYYETNSVSNRIIFNQIISGFTCIEKDRMAFCENGKELNIGDYVMFYNTGAYSMALSPLFIQYYPAIYVEREGEMIIARKPWSVDEYIANSIIE